MRQWVYRIELGSAWLRLSETVSFRLRKASQIAGQQKSRCATRKQQQHCSELRYDQTANGGMPCGQWIAPSHIFEFPRNDSSAQAFA
jgi:hypothetical protein